MDTSVEREIQSREGIWKKQKKLSFEVFNSKTPCKLKKQLPFYILVTHIDFLNKNFINIFTYLYQTVSSHNVIKCQKHSCNTNSLKNTLSERHRYRGKDIKIYRKKNNILQNFN